MDKNRHGFTDLHRCVRSGKTVEVSEMIKSGYSQIDQQDAFGRTALHEAALAGNREMVEVLVKLGANLDIQDKNGITPLHFSVQEKHNDLSLVLLKAGANSNLQDVHGNTPLWRLLFLGRDEKLIRAFIKHGANPKLKNAVGLSPWDLAIQWGCQSWLSGKRPKHARDS